jgi:hypothetical protein
MRHLGKSLAPPGATLQIITSRGQGGLAETDSGSHGQFAAGSAQVPQSGMYAVLWVFVETFRWNVSRCGAVKMVNETPHRGVSTIAV